MQHKKPEAEDIAKAIFDYLYEPEGRSDNPYTYNEEPDRLCLSVDGVIDCNKIAKFVYDRLYAS